MPKLKKMLAILAAAGALAACSSHGPGGVAYATGDKVLLKDAETRAKGDTAASTEAPIGATGGSAGGAGAGGAKGEKEQRGNTPPGTSRDGAGPAAGAIVDPTGAVTNTKPQ